MTDYATLATHVVAGIVSARARVLAVPFKQRVDEETAAEADILRNGYVGIPGSKPGDTGDELTAIQQLLDFYHPRLFFGGSS